MIIPGIMASVPFVTASSYFSTVMADNPSGFWLMDDAPGALVLDSSGNGRHASAVGPEGVNRNLPPLVSDGGYSSELPAGNTTNRINMGPNWGDFTAFTLEGWFNFHSVAREQTIAAKWGRFTYSNNTLFIWFSLEGTISFRVMQTSGVESGHISSGYVPNRRYHLVFTAGAGLLSTYVDGVSVGSASYAGTIRYGTTGEDLSIGAKTVDGVIYDQAGPFGNRSGRFIVDNLAFYHHALPPERVAAHYAAGV